MCATVKQSYKILTYSKSKKTNMLDYMWNKSRKSEPNLSAPLWGAVMSTVSSSVSAVSTITSFIWDPINRIWSSPKEKYSLPASSYPSPTGSYGKPGELYAFVLNEKRNVFKVGKSVNVAQRIRSYRTTQPDGYIFHEVSCDDMDHAEVILHNILKLNGHHVKREIFTLPPEMLKGYMNLVSELCSTLRQTKDVTKVAKMTRFIHQITN